MKSSNQYAALPDSTVNVIRRSAKKMDRTLFFTVMDIEDCEQELLLAIWAKRGRLDIPPTHAHQDSKDKISEQRKFHSAIKRGGRSIHPSLEQLSTHGDLADQFIAEEQNLWLAPAEMTERRVILRMDLERVMAEGTERLQAILPRLLEDPVTHIALDLGITRLALYKELWRVRETLGVYSSTK
ncbi:hypothetical protein ACQZV8_19805 [Magnetococcales bacterium HHB-1]